MQKTQISQIFIYVFRNLHKRLKTKNLFVPSVYILSNIVSKVKSFNPTFYNFFRAPLNLAVFTFLLVFRQDSLYFSILFHIYCKKHKKC